VLRRVDPGLEPCSPRHRVQHCAFVHRALDGLLVDKQSDSILCLRYTIVRLARRNTCCSAHDDACRDGLILKDPAADVDVVR